MGTYQGSALGPLLFSIYANDLSLYVDNSKIVQYADDTQIFLSGPPRDLNNLISSMENDLAQLSHWFSHNGMKINASKTQFIVLGSQQIIRRLPPITLNFMNTAMTGSSSVKNLGVLFDQCMTFNDHVDDVTRRCTGMMRGLSHTRHSVTEPIMVTLLQGLVLSVVRYCISVYGACSGTQIQRVQKLINFAARVISGRRKFDHISDVIRRLGWLRAEQLCKYHCLTTLKKILMTGQPNVISSALTSRHSVHGRNTRQYDQLQTPMIRTEAGRKRFLYLTVTNYNGLPSSVRDAPTIGAFKVRLKRHLLEQQEEQ